LPSSEKFQELWAKSDEPKTVYELFQRSVKNHSTLFLAIVFSVNSSFGVKNFTCEENSKF
jgi:hypothetical protein